MWLKSAVSKLNKQAQWSSMHVAEIIVGSAIVCSRGYTSNFCYDFKFFSQFGSVDGMHGNLTKFYDDSSILRNKMTIRKNNM